MSDIENIASRIADIIISPGTVRGMINGALTVPLDIGYLAMGYFDTESRYPHQTQRIRMVTALRRNIMNYDHIVNAVGIIYQEFNKYLTESQQDNVYRGVLSAIAGRLLATKFVATTAAAVLERVSFIAAAESKGAIGVVAVSLLLGGMSERSIRSSEKLARHEPEIYALLRPCDYDLTYFLFEPAVKPFVDAIHIRATQGKPAFNKIIESVGKKLNVPQAAY